MLRVSNSLHKCRFHPRPQGYNSQLAAALAAGGMSPPMPDAAAHFLGSGHPGGPGLPMGMGLGPEYAAAAAAAAAAQQHQAERAMLV